MNEKYTSLEELILHKYKQDTKDIEYKNYEYEYDKYDTHKYVYPEKKYDFSEYEEFIRKIQMQKPAPEIGWREALDKMPIGFIEKYLRKKKLANIKPEEE